MTCHGLPCAPLYPFWESVIAAFFYGVEAVAYLALAVIGALAALKLGLAVLRLVMLWR